MKSSLVADPNQDKHTQVCKIELEIVGTDKQDRESNLEKLAELHKFCNQAANSALEEYYFSNLFENRIATNEFIHYKLQENVPKSERNLEGVDVKGLKELRLKLAEELKSKYNVGLMGGECSTQNTGYAKASLLFGDTIPSKVLTALTSTTYKKIKNDKEEVVLGLRSIASFKKQSPIPFNISRKHFPLSYDESSDKYTLDPFKGYRFTLKFGKDKSGNRTKVERVLANEYSMCDSAIEIEYKSDRSRKIQKVFLKLMYKLPYVKRDGKRDNVMGIDLGVNTPISWAISGGPERGNIGTPLEFYRGKIAFRKQRKSMQRSLTVGAVSGNGRSKKIQAISKIREKEKDWTQVMNHRYSKEVIAVAVKHGVGTIKLENISGIETKYKFLRDWPYYQLQSMIQYKAKNQGIEVVFINPAHTSTTCTHCGDKGERRDSNYNMAAGMTVADYERINHVPGKFKAFFCMNPLCEKHEKEVNADINAAYNIAKSTNYSKKKNSKELLESLG